MAETQHAQLVEGADFGPYRLIHPLGEGGGGQVWEAEDSRSNRRVALKVMTAVEVESPERLERFEREGRLAAAITHPSCVLVFGAEQVEGRPTISMELMRGGTLRGLLDRGPLEYHEAVRHVLDVIAGLEAAQRAGIIHRDIKPSNCFLEEGGVLTKIGDFGVSRTLEAPADLTMTGMFVGTPSYASPEQVRGEELDFRSDLYAVGVTLYELLTGRVPFQGHGLAVVAQILDANPTPPSSLNPTVPAALDRVVLRLLAKDPAKRFSSYSALRSALTPFTPGVLSAGGVGRRVLASFIDMVALAPFEYALLAYADRAAALLSWILVANILSTFVYFWLLEAHFGASLGKRMMGLMVTSISGGRLGSRAVALRTLVFVVPTSVPAAIALLAGRTDINDPVPATLQILGIVFLFVTMRARNGFAGVHDLLTDSRVVTVRRSSTVGAPDRPLEGVRPVESGEKKLGPYVLETVVWQAQGERLALARDESLDRKVWIHQYEEPHRAPLPERLAISTPGRLGWLQGGRADGGCWDAYAEPSGSSLADWVRSRGRLGWAETRQILRGIARELARPVLERSPALALGRVWVDGTGEPKLTDFPLDPSDVGLESASKEPVEFLRRLAAYCLEAEKALGKVETPSAPMAPVPAHAQDFLAELFGDGAASPSTIKEQLDGLMSGLASVTWLRRGLAIALGALLPLFMGSLVLLPPESMLQGRALPPRVEFFSVTVLATAALAGVVAVIFALGAAGGPVLTAMDLDVRTVDGRAAGRWRCAARTAAAWSPFLISALLLFLVRPTRAQLLWVSRSGEPAPVERGWAFDPGLVGYTAWSLSPDASRIAVTRSEEGIPHIWIKRLSDGSFERLTSHAERELYPAWSPDGSTITYSREDTAGDSTDHFDLWRVRADSRGAPELLVDDERSLLQARWSPDGEWLVARTFALTAELRDVLVLRPGPDDAVIPLAATPDHAEQGAAVSRDGRWVAYSSDESGQDEVYVRSFPDVGTEGQLVSTDGGIAPLWGRNGTELFYIDRGRGLVALSIETDPSFRVVSRDTLFTLPAGYYAGPNYDFYDTTPDGERFLMGRQDRRLALVWLLLALVPWLVGLAITLARPARGPQDWIAGTYLVPK